MQLNLINIKSYSRIDTIDSKFIKLNIEDQKKYIIKKLHSVNWYKSVDRIEYNTYLFYKFNFTVDLIEETYYYFVIDDIKIRIRIQDYFFLKFMNQFKKKHNDWFIEGYLDPKKVIVEYPTFTHNYNKQYRVDYLFHISDNNYLCIEFFEKAHKKCDDPDFKIEKNRIYSLIHDSDDRYKKIIFFAIFWQTKLNDKKYFKDFVKLINQKIDDYTDIENEEKWCINGINKFIEIPILSKYIYQSYQSDNPVIPIDIINSIITFRDENSKMKHMNEFFEDVQELISVKQQNSYNNEEFTLDNEKFILDESDDDNTSILDIKKETIHYKNNKLSITGLTRYLKIKRKYLISIIEEENILNIFTKITNGFVYGLKEQRNLLLNLENNRILGLYDY